MLCPYCQTENREDRDACYVCGKDISTIRLVVNKARQHFNDALEHAERGRSTEAIDELKNALDLDASLVPAHVVLGTLYARDGKFVEARDCWNNALALQPDLQRAHDYLERIEDVESSLPTMRFYRWVAVLMFLLALVMAVAVIYTSRSEPATNLLNQASALVAENRFGEAEDKLQQARASIRPGTSVAAAVVALQQALELDRQQQVRLIQDLKYQQMFPEALDAIAELESRSPEPQTQAVLQSARSDIRYYYYNLIAQFYTAYIDGDLSFEELEAEISRFLQHYPGDAESEEIRQYLTDAERLEVQAAFENIHTRFMQDYDVEAAVLGTSELSKSIGHIASFQEERQLFIEEVLSSLFNLFTGYLDQEDFVRASELLYGIERVNAEFRDVVEVDISGAVELAWSVLNDARRQAIITRIETLISQNQMDVAEEALWFLLQTPDVTPAELGALQVLWRRINRDARLEQFFGTVDDDKFFKLSISDEQSSEALWLYEDFKGADLPGGKRAYLLGLSAAAALSRGDREQATSASLELQKTDSGSTISIELNRLLDARIIQP